VKGKKEATEGATKEEEGEVSNSKDHAVCLNDHFEESASIISVRKAALTLYKMSKIFSFRLTATVVLIRTRFCP